MARRTIPQWVIIAAWLVPLCVLPSATWRLTHLFGVIVNGPGPCDSGTLTGALYISALSIGSVSAALMTLGLVQPWGEIFPRWLPFVGGRPVPFRGVTAIALLGAATLCFLALLPTMNAMFDWYARPSLPPGCTPPTGSFATMLAWIYAPLLAWPPLLCLVALDYYRRGVGRATTAA